MDADETELLPAPILQKGRFEAKPELLLPRHAYRLSASHAVDGRQGVACGDENYFVSGSTTLSRYDADWNLVTVNDAPFEGFDTEVNHIGDVDVYKGTLYAGAEFFSDGTAKNLQIALYDAETLAFRKALPVDPASGQTELSGLTVDPEHGSVWLCSWADGESGRYLYRYDLDSGAYLGKYHLQAAPQWIQGIACYYGWIYLTADDGTADLGEADHVYRCRPELSRSSLPVVLERTLDDVTAPGEVEGISFDRETGNADQLQPRRADCAGHAAGAVSGLS